MRTLITLLALGFSLSGCSDITWQRTKPGQLKGKLVIEWINQDEFLFIPDPTQPLTFTRANNEVITPDAMYTDGGSIPVALRAVKSYSPWGYAPAFIVHDWLFTMKQCKLDGHDKLSLDESATVLAEVLKTVMENPKYGGPNKLVHYSMYEAVRSTVAKDYWENGKCTTLPRVRSTTRSAAPKAAPPAAPQTAPQPAPPSDNERSRLGTSPPSGPARRIEMTF
ncbi:MAG: DUF1353 domain-containing protein [Hyphomicrobium sp.]